MLEVLVGFGTRNRARGAHKLPPERIHYSRLCNIFQYLADVVGFGAQNSPVTGISSTKLPGFHTRNGFPLTLCNPIAGFRAQKTTLVGFDTRMEWDLGHGTSGIRDTELVGFRARITEYLVGIGTQNSTPNIRKHFRFPCVTYVLNNYINKQQYTPSVVVLFLFLIFRTLI